jgi:CheY-like chemotaxis protein
MTSPDVLLAAADQGLYRAKTRGGDRTVLLERKGRSAAVPANEAVEPSRDPVSLAGETVLVVDDDAAVLNLLGRVLLGAGYRVLEAKGAEEAMAHAESSRAIDIVVTDIVMPGISGFRLVEMLAERRPELKALYISGYSEDEIEWGGVPGASKAFLSKPLGPKDLVDAVRRVAAGQAGEPGVAEAPEEAPREDLPLALEAGVVDVLPTTCGTLNSRPGSTRPYGADGGTGND